MDENEVVVYRVDTGGGPVAVYSPSKGAPRIGIGNGTSVGITWMGPEDARLVAGALLDAAVRAGGFPT